MLFFKNVVIVLTKMLTKLAVDNIPLVAPRITAQS